MHRVAVATSDGELSVRCWHSPSRQPRAIVALHGMMSHAGWFAGLAQELVARNISVFASDRRGSGEARGLRGATDLDAWVSDIHDVVALARKHADDVTLFCWCWGALTGTIALGGGLGVEHAVLAAPALKIIADVRRRMQGSVGDTTEDDTVPLPYHPIDDFSDDPAVRKFIDDDSLRWRSVPRAFLAPSQVALTRALEILPRLKRPILCLLAAGDKLVDNAATRALLSGHTIEELPGGHAFVLERPAAFAQRLEQWTHI